MSFSQVNAFENAVCETAAILFRPECVDKKATINMRDEK